jgi:hypothetical protein
MNTTTTTTLMIRCPNDLGLHQLVGRVLPDVGAEPLVQIEELHFAASLPGVDPEVDRTAEAPPLHDHVGQVPNHHVSRRPI